MLLLTRVEFYFPYSSYCRIIFWVCSRNGVGNVGIALVITEQCLHRVKASSASHTSPPVRRLEVCKNLGGYLGRTADPS